LFVLYAWWTCDSQIRFEVVTSFSCCICVLCTCLQNTPLQHWCDELTVSQWRACSPWVTHNRAVTWRRVDLHTFSFQLTGILFLSHFWFGCSPARELLGSIGAGHMPLLSCSQECQCIKGIDKQGCGLGLDVSVSRRSRDVPTSRLGLVSTKIDNVSVSSRSRPLTSRARDQFSAKFYRSR